MTRTLLLLRHSKSSYPSGVADHDRPLAERGIREAPLAGNWIREHAPTVDAVLCSTATRTRQTLDRAGIDAPVDYVDTIYDAAPGTLLGVINAVDPSVSTLLVIAHEPGVSALALGLAGPGSDAEAVGEVASKYPTSAITMLTTNGPWSHLSLRGAALIAFHIPR
ncbi:MULTISPECIES: histidine phosphatase family protein [unclassified Mycolicibacterium]|uniref:SixA phosphatase family protein n=1 Tax=unclassified Mycolicibacterium TaxID=2636767 RepID=UPI001F4C3B21|nr:histidine phosphatase family protein [Mycolicibacterium sp. YH-1]UNB54409.1 histidine phosphatase family protein [Mycolicibacterium sp. YH-1]